MSLAPDADPDLPPRSAAEYILERLEEPRFREPFLCAMEVGLIRGDRSTMNRYARMLKLIGGEQNLALIVVQKFGAKDEHELEQLVHSGRRMESLTQGSVPLEEQKESAIELLRLCLAEKPEWRAEVISRLSSGAELESDTNNGEPQA